MVILAVANANRAVTYVRLVTLRFRFVAQFLFLVFGIHRELILEHIARQVHKAAALEQHVIRRLHVGALGRGMVTQGERNMVSGTIVQELVQVHGEVARHIQLGRRHRCFRLGRPIRSRKRRKVTILVTYRSRQRNKVGKVHLATRTGRIAPFGIHIRKAHVIEPESTL